MSLQQHPMDSAYDRYLKDESGLSGFADAIVFPESLEEIQSVVEETAKHQGTVTAQGGLTGLCGSAVPCGGVIMNLSRFTAPPVFSAECSSVSVPAGMSLQDLADAVRERTGGKLFFPVEPTEKTATVGGIIAQNAGGLTQQKYRGLSTYVKRLTVVRGDGKIRMADTPEAVAAYIGSEGMAGIIAEAELSLVPLPREVWSIVFFFEQLSAAVEFSRAIVREDTQSLLTAVELFDRETIRLIGEHRNDLPDLKSIPEIGPEVGAALLVEVGADREEQIEEFVTTLVELSEPFGCDADRAWVVSGHTEAEKLRRLKHAATESIHLFYTQPLAKDGACRRADLVLHGEDFSRSLTEVLRKTEAENLRCCVCGHAGLNQLSVTLLSQNPGEFERFDRIRGEYWEQRPPLLPKEISEYGIGKLFENLSGASASVAEQLRGRLPEPSDGRFNSSNATKRLY